jgi:membrane-associated phospholipid phosphatase
MKHKWLYFLFPCIFLIILSYYYADRAVVWFLVSHHSREWSILKILANDIVNAIALGIFLFYFFFAVQFMRKKLTPLITKLIVMSNAVVISLFLKDGLKIVFGRYWIDTFKCNNPSLIKNNVYGFNWFTGESVHSSFPSGHSTFILAFTVSMWFLFPKLRWLWCLLALFVLIGQIGMYYHFVSDALAGIMLGSIVAICNYRYHQRS